MAFRSALLLMKTSKSSSYSSRSGRLKRPWRKALALFEIMEIAKNWKPLLSRVYRRDYSNLQKDREDVLIESMTLLQVISGEADRKIRLQLHAILEQVVYPTRCIFSDSMKKRCRCTPRSTLRVERGVLQIGSCHFHLLPIFVPKSPRKT